MNLERIQEMRNEHAQSEGFEDWDDMLGEAGWYAEDRKEFLGYVMTEENKVLQKWFEEVGDIKQLQEDAERYDMINNPLNYNQL